MVPVWHWSKKKTDRGNWKKREMQSVESINTWDEEFVFPDFV